MIKSIPITISITLFFRDQLLTPPSPPTDLFRRFLRRGPQQIKVLGAASLCYPSDRDPHPPHQPLHPPYSPPVCTLYTQPRIFCPSCPPISPIPPPHARRFTQTPPSPDMLRPNYHMIVCPSFQDQTRKCQKTRSIRSNKDSLFTSTVKNTVAVGSNRARPQGR